MTDSQKTKKIICLHAGPGAGKSTICAGLFYFLKVRHYNAEMNREYIKEWVWEGRNLRTGDQTYLFAKQSRRERIYIEQGLDFIVTDSPLLLNYFYGQKYDPYEQKYGTIPKMLENHHKFCKEHGYKVEHFFINRPDSYDPTGRYQSKEESLQCDREIKDLLKEFNVNFHEVQTGENTVEEILAILGV